MNSRAIAVKVLFAVLKQGVSLTAALSSQLSLYPKLHDPQLVQEISYGVLRHFDYLDALLQPLLSKPLKSKDEDIACLLLIGIYQLHFLQVPPHAAISETVNAASMLKKEWAKALVNAVLRQFQRQQSTPHTPSTDPAIQFSHPQWLIDALKASWPDNWEAILEANNQHPPMTLRVNQRRTNRDEYLQKLHEANIEAIAHPLVTTAIELVKPVPVSKLPAFRAGDVSVQDAASQMAVNFLQLAPSLRVLDACAAPGGKTCHILEAEPDLAAIIAVDIEAERVKKIKENLHRLHLRASLLVGDANQPASWWDGELFDRILCDAPCSATGVIRRHPDIKYLRELGDINQLHRQQLSILQALWPLLKADGKLVYSTCSILRAENQDVISEFLKREPGAKFIHEHQICTGQYNMDGFYYAVLERA